MQTVGAESGAVSWLECMAWARPCLRLCSRYSVPSRLETEQAFSTTEVPGAGRDGSL
jgi:hypothetical protein